MIKGVTYMEDIYTSSNGVVELNEETIEEWFY